MNKIKIAHTIKNLSPLILSSIIFLLHLFTLGRSPFPHVDEAWLVSRAWGMAKTGLPYGQLDAGLLENLIDHYWLIYQLGITSLHGLILWIVGSPNLISLRFFSLIMGMGMIFVSYKFANEYMNKQTAFLSSLILGVSLAFFHSSHMVRYDIMAAMLGYSALYIVSVSQKKLYWYLIAGLLLGLAIETHLNSMLFFPPIGLIYYLRSGSRILKDKQLMFFIAGITISIIGFLILHVFPDPADFWFAYQLNFIGNTTQTIRQKINSFTDIWILIFVAGTTFSLLLIPAFFSIIRNSVGRQKQLLAISLLIILSAALIIPNKTAHYGIFIAPPVTWLGTWWLMHVYREPWRANWKNYIARILAASALVTNIGLSVISILPDDVKTYQSDLALLRSFILPGDQLMGTQVYWLGLYDHDYFSWELLFLYNRAYPDTDLEDAFEFYRPDVLIIDQSIQDLISDQIDPESRWNFYHISRSEWDLFMFTHEVEIIELKTINNNPLTIYRLVWS